MKRRSRKSTWLVWQTRRNGLTAALIAFIAQAKPSGPEPALPFSERAVPSRAPAPLFPHAQLAVARPTGRDRANPSQTRLFKGISVVGDTGIRPHIGYTDKHGTRRWASHSRAARSDFAASPFRGRRRAGASRADAGNGARAAPPGRLADAWGARPVHPADHRPGE